MGSFSIVGIIISVMVASFVAYFLIPQTITRQSRTVACNKIHTICQNYLDLLEHASDVPIAVLSSFSMTGGTTSSTTFILNRINHISFHIELADQILREADVLDSRDSKLIKDLLLRLVGETAYEYSIFKIDPSLFQGNYHEGEISFLKLNPSTGSLAVGQESTPINTLYEMRDMVSPQRRNMVYSFIRFASRNVDRG